MSETRGRKAETSEVGTEKSGFALGSIWGPFRCGHCRHFEHGKGREGAEGTCAHPEVIADAGETLKHRDSRNHPYVDPSDCCKYVRRASKASDAEKSGMRG